MNPPELSFKVGVRSLFSFGSCLCLTVKWGDGIKTHHPIASEKEAQKIIEDYRRLHSGQNSYAAAVR